MTWWQVILVSLLISITMVSLIVGPAWYRDRKHARETVAKFDAFVADIESKRKWDG